MPKKIKFESAKYSILSAGKRVVCRNKVNGVCWDEFINNLKFEKNKNTIKVYFDDKCLEFEISGFRFYKKYVEDNNTDFEPQLIKNLNYKYAEEIIKTIASKSNYIISIYE